MATTKPKKKKLTRHQQDLASFRRSIRKELMSHHTLTSGSYDHAKHIPVSDVKVVDGEIVTVCVTIERHLSDNDARAIGIYAIGYAVGKAAMLKSLKHRFTVEVYHEGSATPFFSKKHEPR